MATRTSTGSTHRSRKSTTTTTTANDSPSRSSSAASSPTRRPRSTSPPTKLKDEFQDLNDRLAAYLGRVAYLESERDRLLSHITATEDAVEQSTRELKSRYEERLVESKRDLSEALGDKVKVGKDADRYKAEAEEWKAKYQSRDRDAKAAEKKVLDLEAENADLRARLSAAEVAKKQADKELARLRSLLADQDRQLKELQKQLDEESSLREKYQLESEAMEKELEFRTMVHEEELAALRNQPTLGDSGWTPEEYEARLQEALNDMRQEYEDQLEQVRAEVDQLYSRKSTDMVDGSRLREMEAMLRRERENFEARLAEKDVEIASLRQELDDRIKDYLYLLEVKLKLENELATYRTLLEGGEKRFNMSPSKSPSSRNVFQGSGRKRTIDLTSPSTSSALQSSYTATSLFTSESQRGSAALESGSGQSKRTTATSSSLSSSKRKTTPKTPKTPSPAKKKSKTKSMSSRSKVTAAVSLSTSMTSSSGSHGSLESGIFSQSSSSLDSLDGLPRKALWASQKKSSSHKSSSSSGGIKRATKSLPSSGGKTSSKKRPRNLWLRNRTVAMSPSYD